MPHLRQNLVTRQWVIVSTERAKRPHSLTAEEPALPVDLPPYDPECPFCLGNDGADEREYLQLPDDGPWQVRVLANKYPALDRDAVEERGFDGVERIMSGFGYHEVVIEGRRHNLCPATDDPTMLAHVFRAFQLRGNSIGEDNRIEYIQYFKNHGRAAGASLHHPHSQLIALPVVPGSARLRAERARSYFDDIGHCVFCKVLAEEIERNQRVVAINEHAVAFVLYAALSPFHIWVMPRRHMANFLEATEDDVRGVTDCLHQVLRLLHQGLNDPPFNYVLRSCPLHDRGREYLHWYVSVVARISTSAGFELGSGMFINPVLPEHSAAFLREVAQGLSQ
ncbi:MAG: galactose-1-phosphate uridylyltransferase [Caldilineales bacterium]|nr:galactose-1-phosphate uridylyltransferase [Caldilineales bacterium]